MQIRHWANAPNFTFICVSLTKTSDAKFKFTDNGSSKRHRHFLQKKKSAAASGGSGDPVIAVLPSVTHFVRALDARPNGQLLKQKFGSRIDPTSSFRFPSKFFTAFLVSDDADKPQKRRKIVLHPIDMKTGERTYS
jgi:hypothetical protein